MKVFLAFDCETTGPDLSKECLLSIGLCAIDEDGNTVKKTRFSLNPKDSHPGTMEFWQQHKDIEETLRKEALPGYEAVEEFAKCVDELDDEYTVILVTDGLFDIAWINEYFRRIGRLPLIYKHGKYENFRWRPAPLDIDNYVCGFTKSKPGETPYDTVAKLTSMCIVPGLLEDCKHTHYPDDDAHCMAVCAFAVNIFVLTNEQ